MFMRDLSFSGKPLSPLPLISFSCTACQIGSFEEVVDPTGCGDAFIGGFLTAISHQSSLEATFPLACSFIDHHF
jgi:hypothetical protein